MNKKKISENARKLLEYPTSNKLMKESFIEVMPSKKNENILTPLFVFTISFIFSIIIGFSAETINILRDTNDLFLTIVMALFGITFTGYAFFQALVSPELLQRLLLLEVEDGNSYLKDNNSYFMHVINIHICVIILNVVVALILYIMPDTFNMFNSQIVNEGLCSIILIIYFYLNIYAIWEVKSFVFNLYQYFNISASEKVLTMLNDSKDNDTKD